VAGHGGSLTAAYLSGVIEARFDDLTGTSPSFRLTEPAGVIEATRPDEVAGALDAADAAASRGLWVAGFVSYEAAPGLDDALHVRARAPADPFERLPLVWFGMFERREESVLPRPREEAPTGEKGPWTPTIDRARYDRAIATIHERIGAGDTYQVNYTMRLRSRVEGDERGLYRDLCFAQRGAHNGYINAGRFRIMSASPELFFRIVDGRLQTRPMKGTAPRGRWADEDVAVFEALRASVKDRAENAMIVDLLRNDLGRVARTGSVEWSSVFEPERYETVWQLTSTVTSEVEPGRSLSDLFRALFPSGSVTGAPKIATMSIIADLEDSPRGVYCGSVGWIAPPSAPGPRASFNVAIRTIMLDSESRVAEYGVGGGITWDSSAGAEYEETVAKARVLTSRRPPFDLLETMRRDPGEPILHLEPHLARLGASADYFGFEFDEQRVREALEDAGRDAPEPTRVRLRLSRSGNLEVSATKLDPGGDGEVKVALDDVGVDPADVFLFHKTSLRSRYEDARDRHPEATDVLLVNTRGEVTESSIANLAAKIGRRWLTPPLESGLLPGIGRQIALQDGRLVEAVITKQDLREAEEIALVSDSRGWRKALLV
jgi:para-aminobenzoate synthetase / 4-amino-4-deoxychorismate lyase